MNSNATVAQTVAIGKTKVRVEPEPWGVDIRIRGSHGPLDSVAISLDDAIAIAKFVLSLEADKVEDDEDAYFDFLANLDELRRDFLADATSAGWGHD